jgi:tRNA threonylcarbamoyladenosine biosynthesis protein TsaE
MNKLPQEATIIYSLEELSTVVNNLYLLKNVCKVYTFSGPLGAGKTTLVRSLLKHFTITEPVTSPTFSYLNVYENNKGELLYHFDLYRLSNLQEFLEAGFDEFLYLKNSWVFIEWPDIIKPLLTHNVCFISIDYEKENQRKLNCTIIE